MKREGNKKAAGQPAGDHCFVTLRALRLVPARSARRAAWTGVGPGVDWPVAEDKAGRMGGEVSVEAGGEDGAPRGFEGSPIVLVVCGPSGVGKSTLIDLLVEENEGFGFSVSHTTRDPRGDEQVRKIEGGWVCCGGEWWGGRGHRSWLIVEH